MWDSSILAVLMCSEGSAAVEPQVNLSQSLSNVNWIKQGIAGREKNLLFKIEYLGISKIPNLQFRVEFYHI